MAGDAIESLEDLCKICMIEDAKYQCPRCGARTCSSKCVKAHKQRSGCNGLRNPGAFKSRAELATPTAFDQDFNYISELQRQHDPILGRGKQKKEGLPKKERSRKHDHSLNSKLKERMVNVRYMPQWMDRAKQNRSTWDSKAECIRWTVEWKHRDGSTFYALCPENISVDEAYSKARGSTKVVAEKRHFYLEGNQIASKERVLVSLRPLSQLQHCLKARTLIEFPTIYVLEQPSDSLPEGFITWQQAKQQSRVGENEKVSTNLNPPEQSKPLTDNPAIVDTSTVDDSEVLESVQKDLEM